MNPQTLRRNILTRRDTLSKENRFQYSQLITKRAIGLEQFAIADTLFIYVNFRSEVETRPLIDHMLVLGKKVVVPVTLVREKALLPVYIKDPEQELAPGYCLIPEPIATIRERQLVSPETIDIIFLPGSVFDEQGGRMGYGGGYYDRFVSAQAPQALRVGLAYELQMVDRAPLQEHDELMDLILTEKRTILGR
ncbi:MAG: 5-formyltetrahydrofolate cyclo-ligase [Proteobacteria bacterium]|nr:5-formyltetrahydrofolate cyclo-ligase [Pseudomonadota bacterium]MBU1058297.1 5-formyltetrahydrofolate cyclo-ligase [Pseudomonadota bacterium]